MLGVSAAFITPLPGAPFLLAALLLLAAMLVGAVATREPLEAVRQRPSW